MNRATKAALINIQANPFDLKAAFFHSTPVLDRRRRNHWDSVGSLSTTLYYVYVLMSFVYLFTTLIVIIPYQIFYD